QPPHTSRLCHVSQPRPPFRIRVLPQILRHSSNCASLRISLGIRPLRLASFASPVSRRFGLRGGREEAHLFARRSPARTARLAINLRRLHRIHELPIRSRIPLQHLLPLLPGKITRNHHRTVTCFH